MCSTHHILHSLGRHFLNSSWCFKFKRKEIGFLILQFQGKVGCKAHSARCKRPKSSTPCNRLMLRFHLWVFVQFFFFGWCKPRKCNIKASPPWETMQEHAAQGARFSLTHSQGLEARIPAPKPHPQQSFPLSPPFTYSTHTNTHTQSSQEGRAEPDHSASRRGKLQRADLFSHAPFSFASVSPSIWL